MKKNIRNFCIIAHIDHGKSTLADRLLEFTNTIQVTEGQMLDDMDLEKERGITIKSHAIQMEYVYKGEKYILNLIDTPGHVDFSYEVSRSIAACEGALLIVDASQGVQAQTISNLYMAIEHDLEIIPVINKCDMASAMPEEVEDEIVELLGCKREEIIRASGKTGMGVEEILEAVVERIPHPEGDEEAPLQALIFDSVFNSFRGIIAYFKIVNGVIRKGDKVKFFNTGKEYDADEIGVLKMDMVPRQELRTGDVGYIISGIKTSREVKVGDTITHIARPCKEAIAGNVFLLHQFAALAQAERHDGADIVRGGNHRSTDIRLFDAVYQGGIGHAAGVVHLGHVSLLVVDVVRHVRHGGNHVHIEFAVQAFLHNLHVEQS